MHLIPLPGTSLSVSPLCLGGVPFGHTLSDKETFALLDRFVALGGNFIDTARIYSDWVPGETRRSERVLGDWMQARRNRPSLVISTKGAHPFIESLDTPRSAVAEIRDDLEGSLRTLRLDTVDLYWLHRDDPTRSVGHFIDLLNAFVREGKVRHFGASNWSTERLRAANDFARGPASRASPPTSRSGASACSSPARRPSPATRKWTPECIAGTSRPASRSCPIPPKPRASSPSSRGVTPGSSRTSFMSRPTSPREKPSSSWPRRGA